MANDKTTSCATKSSTALLVATFALAGCADDEPIEVVSARGVWLTAADGRRYLDMYNNVPCVGHAHPRVSEAIARQGRVLNTNVRYLDRSAIELAERLAW